VTIYFPDISSGQAGISLTGALAVIGKATESNNYTNPYYSTFKSGAASAGAYFVAYHFLHSSAGSGGAPISSQAAYCYSVVGSTPLMLDVETTTGSSPTLADVTAFIDAYRAHGGILYWLYLPNWYWQDWGSPALTSLIGRGMLLWSSNFTTYTDATTGAGWQPYGGMTPTVWQYSDSNSFGGASPVDFSAFQGSYPGLEDPTSVAATVAQFEALSLTGVITVAPPPVVNPVGYAGTAGSSPGGGGGGGSGASGGAGGAGRITVSYKSADGSAAANIVRFLLSVPSTEMPTDSVIMRVYTSGKVGNLDLFYTTGGDLTMSGWTQGVQLFTTGLASWHVNGQPILVSMELQQYPGNSIAWGLNAINLDGTELPGISGVYSSGIVGQITEIITNASGNAPINDTAIGHIAVQYAYTNIYDLIPVLAAYAGELAADRFLRLCGEEGVYAELMGTDTDTEQMGAQVAGVTLLTLLQQCVAVDMGIMYEPTGNFGLGYRTRVDLSNQQAAAVLNYASAALATPLQPTDDDQHTKNDVTVTRNGGSSAHLELASGNMSVNLPPNGVGDYPVSETVYSAFDGERLNDTAAWLLWLGTQDGLRYPVLNVDLSRSEVAEIFSQVQQVGPGDLIQISNPPAFLPPGAINQLALGFTISLNTFVYTISFNCVPGRPYQTAVFEDPTYSRADTDGSGLLTAIDTAMTSFAVSPTVPTAPTWTTSAAEFPFDIVADGEQMTVTSISAAVGGTGVVTATAVSTLAITATASGGVAGITGSTNYAGAPTIGMALTVEALSGAAPAANVIALGAHNASYSAGSSSVPHLGITPNSSGSRISGALMDWIPGTTYTPNSNTVFSQNVNDTINGAGYGTFNSASSPFTGVATYYGGTAPSNTRVNIALGEVLATAGNIVVEAVTTAVASLASAYPGGAVQQTAYFPVKPPSGTLLVATVCCNSNYLPAGQIVMSLADSSGLTWYALSESDATSGAYAGVWIAQIP